MNNEDGVPIDELRSDIYFEGIEIRTTASKLLKECRAFKITFWKSIRKKGIQQLAARYDNLYEKYVSHDAYVLSYAGMCSNPWSRTEEDEVETKNIETLMKLNISADGLISQRETIRMLLTDISNQLNNL